MEGFFSKEDETAAELIDGKKLDRFDDSAKDLTLDGKRQLCLDMCRTAKETHTDTNGYSLLNACILC